jgi:thiol peroxidase
MAPPDSQEMPTEQEVAAINDRFIFFGDEAYRLVRQTPREGELMPDFLLWQFHDDVAQRVSRADLIEQQMPALFCCMHSVDAEVGVRQARRVERLLSDFGGHVRGILVSSDLPFTQNRFVNFETLFYLTAASDYRGHFGKAFGVHVEEFGLIARSLFVTDRNGVLTHSDIVSEFTDEPDYMSAMDALGDLL